MVVTSIRLVAWIAVQAFVVRESAHPCAKVRQRPATNASSKVCIAPGVQVTGIGVAPFWRHVRLANGKSGWLPKQALAASGAGGASLTTTTTTNAGGVAAAEDMWLTVHIVDVGQGDGIWIHTADDGIPGNGRFEGRNIVIDGGPNDADGRTALLDYMRSQAPDDAIIDALIITHPHDDHYPGADAILSHYQVREYYDPGYPSTSSRYRAFRQRVAHETVDGQPITQHIGLATFGHPDWGSEVDVRFLYAYPGSPAGLGSDNTLVNNASIVLRIAYGSQSFLFMGDAEGKGRDQGPAAAHYAEERLLANPGPGGLHATVLKVAHHGSETSSTIPFINAVDPQVVIVSSGRRKYGPRYLPDTSTLHRYCTHNPAIRIYRTDENDAAEHHTRNTDADGDDIVVRTNGVALLVEAHSAGLPFNPTTCSWN